MTPSIDYKPVDSITEGTVVSILIQGLNDGDIKSVTIVDPFKTESSLDRSQIKSVTSTVGSVTSTEHSIPWDTTGLQGGHYTIRVQTESGVTVPERQDILVSPRLLKPDGSIAVSMRRTAIAATPDLPLWVVIRAGADALSFENYKKHMDMVLCNMPIGEKDKYSNQRYMKRYEKLKNERYLPFTDTDSYRLLKVATEAFVTVNCGIVLDEYHFSPSDLGELMKRVEVSGSSGMLSRLWASYLKEVNGMENKIIPYLALIRKKLPEADLKEEIFIDLQDHQKNHCQSSMEEYCYGVLKSKLRMPCLLELIWSYWHEEGMLVQTMAAITQRFQNKRSSSAQDPLANLETDPLRPLNNLLWGYIQDEIHRLTVVRRAYEYDHHYGMRIYGKALPDFRPADSRSKFIEAFHNLLNLCAKFYKSDDDTTVVADAFPVLNSLRDVHLLLSEGAHNQFGDLPATARMEMLMQQWMLARPEFREFLPRRVMVAYPEEWMDSVDSMKKMQSWIDVNVLQFRNLGMFGEQVLLSIRYGAWADTYDPKQAGNWARFWRAEVQGYIHAYRAVTGVDLPTEVTGKVDTTLPAVHLRNRLMSQTRMPEQQAALTLPKTRVS